MNPLRNWLLAATLDEKNELYKRTGITRRTMHQMAHAYKSGGELRLAPETARKIEKASTVLVRQGLPALRREDLSPSCSGCEYAARCRK